MVRQGREWASGWSLGAVGVVLLCLSVAGFLLDPENLLVDLAERAFPVVAALVLVAFNVRLRRRGAAGGDVAFVALGALATGVLFAAFERWTLFVTSFESQTPADIDYVLLNGAAVGAIAGAFLGFQYRQLRGERDRLERAADDLRRANDRLQARNERLDEFASMVSHDLRNPLSIATGYLTLARETGDEGDFETVENALSRAETITTEMLELARQGRTVGERGPVDLHTVARRAWSNVDTPGVTLVADTDESVEADANRLQQLFENLFRNSLEHGPPGLTTVRVGAGPERFYVEDDGVGFDASVAAGLFSTGYSTSEGGTGYGLAIVASIAEAHGWSVAAARSGRGGARFEVRGVDFVDHPERTPAGTPIDAA